MREKVIPKKYMLVLQKIGLEQEVVEYDENLNPTLVQIESFTDIKKTFKFKKDAKVKKNTLAFFDAITNNYGSYDEFVGSINPNMYPFDYRPLTSFIGFLNNQYMNTLELSFNDPLLAHIASVANGNQINKDDPQTIKAITEIMDMFEDLDSDFADKLYAYNEEYKAHPKFDIPTDLINSIRTYRGTKKSDESRRRYGYKLDETIEEDLFEFKKQIVSKLESYKNFREMYRFRKKYLFDKQLEEQKPVIPKSNQKLGIVDKYEELRLAYEEAHQKDYPTPRAKVLTKEIPGQISMFD